MDPNLVCTSSVDIIWHLTVLSHQQAQYWLQNYSYLLQSFWNYRLFHDVIQKSRVDHEKTRGFCMSTHCGPLTPDINRANVDNQCWLIMSMVVRYSPGGNSTGNVSSSKWQWVKYLSALSLEFCQSYNCKWKVSAGINPPPPKKKQKKNKQTNKKNPKTPQQKNPNKNKLTSKWI